MQSTHISEEKIMDVRKKHLFDIGHQIIGTESPMSEIELPQMHHKMDKRELMQ